MAQYVSRFIPDYATITTPLRLLTRQDTPWKWEQEEQRALNELKEALVGDQVMLCYVILSKPVHLVLGVYGGRELPIIILMVFYFKITISIRNKLICNTKQMLI
jgi:hypothetical protein